MEFYLKLDLKLKVHGVLAQRSTLKIEAIEARGLKREGRTPSKRRFQAQN